MDLSNLLRILKVLERMSECSEAATKIENELNQRILDEGMETAVGMIAALPLVLAHSMAAFNLTYNVSEKVGEQGVDLVCQAIRDRYKEAMSEMKKDEKKSEAKPKPDYTWTRMHKL